MSSGELSGEVRVEGGGGEWCVEVQWLHWPPKSAFTLQIRTMGRLVHNASVGPLPEDQREWRRRFRLERGAPHHHVKMSFVDTYGIKLVRTCPLSGI
jgi:hypothetical protein